MKRPMPGRVDGCHQRVRHGQVTVEMAVLFICIIGALVWLSFYVQRAMQGTVKGNADGLGQQFSTRSEWRSASSWEGGQHSQGGGTTSDQSSCSKYQHNLGGAVGTLDMSACGLTCCQQAQLCCQKASMCCAQDPASTCCTMETRCCQEASSCCH